MNLTTVVCIAIAVIVAVKLLKWSFKTVVKGAIVGVIIYLIFM